jgi:hypothetical protein
MLFHSLDTLTLFWFSKILKAEVVIEVAPKISLNTLRHTWYIAEMSYWQTVYKQYVLI